MSFHDKFSTQALAVESPTLRRITQRIQQLGGINLGQGVCQLPPPAFLETAVTQAVREGLNRYTNPRGLISLRQAIGRKLQHFNGINADPETEILITCGSTGAFEAVSATLINPNDEVVSFSPFYPYHHNTLKRYGAKVHYVPLQPPDWKFEKEKLSKLISPRTKFVLLNTPANPTGKVFTREELEFIGELCHRNNVLVVTDEIYEYMVYGDRRHISPASIESLRSRTISIGGYSKTFAITGWRIGYAVVPRDIGEAMTALLDNIYVCAPAPLQEAVARTIDELGDSFYVKLNDEYTKKRDYFAQGLKSAGLLPFIPQGAYYMMGHFGERYSNFGSIAFVDFMMERVGVAAVPAVDFVTNGNDEPWVRFCFSVPDEVLHQAVSQLRRLDAL